MKTALIYPAEDVLTALLAKRVIEALPEDEIAEVILDKKSDPFVAARTMHAADRTIFIGVTAVSVLPSDLLKLMADLEYSLKKETLVYALIGMPAGGVQWIDVWKQWAIKTGVRLGGVLCVHECDLLRVLRYKFGALRTLKKSIHVLLKQEEGMVIKTHLSYTGMFYGYRMMKYTRKKAKKNGLERSKLNERDKAPEYMKKLS